MWSLLSLLIANIFMEHYERNTIEINPPKPHYWKGFVDDTFVISPHPKDSLIHIFNHLNNLSPHIQFTMETK